MGTPLDRAPGPDDPSPFAPRWAHGGARTSRSSAPNLRHIFADDADPFVAAPAASLDPDSPNEPFRVPRSLDPTLLAEPSPMPRVRARLGSVALVALAVTAAAVTALIAVKLLPPGGGIAPADQRAVPNSFRSRFSDAGQAERSPAAIPRLIVVPPPPGENADTFPLGITLEGAPSGAAVVISGLPAGTTLSAGTPAGAKAWRLSGADLDHATIRPPADFAGAMEPLAELRLMDGSVVERRPLRFERVSAGLKPPNKPIRQLDAHEIVSLLKRGEGYMAAGDIAAARLVFQRAAEAGDARAALALGATFDPNVLGPLGISGVFPDVGLALTWYEKAKEFGSAEASRRLERLASKIQ